MKPYGFLQLLFLVSLCLATAGKSFSANAPHREFPSTVQFIENKNQWDDFIKYEAEFRGGKLFLEENRFSYVFYNSDDLQSLHPHEGKQIDKVRLHAIKINPIDANPHPALTSNEPGDHFNNYFIGKDSSKWATDVRLFKSVVYNDLYPNVDMKFYSSFSDIKYDFVIRPGACIKDIKLAYEGADKLSLKNGSLVIQLSVGDIIEERPYAYQVIDNKKKEVRCKFVLDGNVLSFKFPHGFDKSLPVIIDPTLIFSSFTGSTADNWGFTATYDAAGDLYSGGNVNSVGYPTTAGAFQQTYNGGGFAGNGWACDMAIAKFNPTGTQLLYATYLGGSDNEQPQSLVVDGNNNLIIFGTSYSSNYPVTAGCYDTSRNGLGDIVISKLSVNGNQLLGSTFVGGSADDGLNTDPGFATKGPLKYNYSDEARGEIIFDSNNDYIIGSCTKSSDFPTTAGVVQPVFPGTVQDGIVFKINSSLTSMVWSTYIGGKGMDAVYDCVIDKSGDLFIAGGTNSNNFPTTPGSLHPTYNGGVADGFILHMNSSATTVLASTYIGTASYDQVFFVELDLVGDVYCMGQTEGQYPVTAGVYSNFLGKQFIHKLSPDLSTTVYSTVFGSGSAYPNISPTAFLVDTCENVYVAGWGRCLSLGSFTTGNVMGMPITPGAFQSTTAGGCDFYFIVLSRDALSLSYATYFGGALSAEHVDGGTSRFDKTGVIYEAVCAGCGGRSDFPTTPGTVSNTNNSMNCNNGVIKLAFNLYKTISKITTVKARGCVPFTITLTNTSINSVAYVWDFGDGSPTSTVISPTHTYTTPGVYRVMLIATNNNSCNQIDTTYLDVTVLAPIQLPLSFITKQTDPCDSFIVDTQLPTNNGILYQWNFGDGYLTTGYNPSHLYGDSGTYQITLIATDTACATNSDTVINFVHFRSAAVNADVAATNSTTGCPPLYVSFNNNSSQTGNHFWDFGDGSPIDTAYNTSHTFTTPGNYQVKFIISDTLSCNLGDTAYIDISVQGLGPVVPEFSSILSQQCQSPSAFFVFTGSGANTFSWDFGDGSFGIGSNISHTYLSSGIYTVSLLAYDSVCGTTDTISHAVTFYAPVTASVAAAGPAKGCNPFSVSFNNNSSIGLNHSWDFGDGSPVDTSFNATHVFTAPGNYHVRFIVSDPNSCNLSDSAFVDIIVLPSTPLVATFNSNVHQLCLDPSADFIFTGSGGNIYDWNFGDGFNSSGTNVSHSFPSGGSFTVTLTVTDSVCGTTDTMSQLITFNINRVNAIINAGPSSGCSPLNVSFSNNSSQGINHYWDFGDGSPVDTTFNVTHTYTSPGIYNVRFFVNDPNTCNMADTDYVSINVSAFTPIVPAFNSTLHQQCTNPSADFSYTGTGGNTFHWDFGDGTLGTGRNISHTYSSSGTYTVTLLIDDSICGNRSGTSHNITFTGGLNASIAAVGSTSGCSPLNVVFTNNSSTGTNYFWDFGDGSPIDTAFNSSHTFTTSGNFLVRFIVSDPNSCNRSDTDFVNINVLPSIPVVAAFNTTMHQLCQSPSADFSFTGSGGNIYNWDFGDGTFSSGLNVSHTYSSGGNYSVTLTVNDTVCGNNGTSTQSITFNVPVDAVITAIGATNGCSPLNVFFSNNSTTGANYSWDFGDGSPVDTSYTTDHTFSTPGNFRVRFIVSDPNSCNLSDSAFVNINVLPSTPVVAAFNTTLHQLCLSPSADFSFTGSGGNNFNWDFGDGTTASGLNVSHNYSTGGNFTVTLRVNDTICGSSGITSQLVTFNIPVNAAVSAVGATSGCAPLNVSFANNSSSGVSYSWDFGDGGVDSTYNTSHVFMDPGIYLVRFIASDPNSCNLADTDYVQVNVYTTVPIIASFALNVSSICDSADATVLFDGTGGDTYAWDFGDGTTGNGVTVNHHYSHPGTYNIILMINDSTCNQVTAAWNTVTILPSVKAGINTNQVLFGCAPQTIHFSNSYSSSGNYLWDFGDNTFSTEHAVEHDFNLPGVYNVSLTVSDSLSCNLEDKAVFGLKVYEMPEAGFKYTLDKQSYYSEVSFIDESSANSAFYRWNFGDALSDSTKGSVMHDYYGAGTFTACLNVTTANGCTDSTCTDIFIENSESMYIPSSFTPNGDGKNDVFKIYFTGIKEIEVMIYDRWGKKIYQYNTLDGGWDGTCNGNRVLEDVYVYKLTAKGVLNDHIEKTGKVSLIY